MGFYSQLIYLARDGGGEHLARFAPSESPSPAAVQLVAELEFELDFRLLRWGWNLPVGRGEERRRRRSRESLSSHATIGPGAGRGGAVGGRWPPLLEAAQAGESAGFRGCSWGFGWFRRGGCFGG